MHRRSPHAPRHLERPDVVAAHPAIAIKILHLWYESAFGPRFHFSRYESVCHASAIGRCVFCREKHLCTNKSRKVLDFLLPIQVPYIERCRTRSIYITNLPLPTHKGVARCPFFSLSTVRRAQNAHSSTFLICKITLHFVQSYKMCLSSQSGIDAQIKGALLRVYPPGPQSALFYPQ